MIMIRGGRIVDPASGREELLDLLVEGDRITYMGKDAQVVADAQVIDAAGKVVAPGLVDVHVHFRDPGLTYKEDMVTGSAAAAAGGFTSVVCMANTKPVVDHPETLRRVLDSAKEACIRVYTVAAVSRNFEGRELTGMAELLELGAVGFSDDGIPLRDAAFLRQAMERARELNACISLHEEDPALIGNPGINAAIAPSLGLAGAPPESESSMVIRDCAIALETGARVHMQHLSCAASVEAVRSAKRAGAQVTAEATPQHFSLTQEAVLEKGALAKLNPPLRSEADRQAIIGGLCDGTIDLIATDHAPHSAEEKSRPLAEAPSGMLGLETALALGITHLVRPGHMTLPQLLHKMTAAPAALYGLEAGRLEVGGPADILIFDEGREWTVPSRFFSKSANSPFVGQRLWGRVCHTLCGGKVVYSGETAR